MKIVISESQYKRLIEDKEEEQKVLHIPSLKFFNDDWFLLQEFLESKGNPLYSIKGDLDLEKTPVESIGNLQSVGGYLDLGRTPIESLGDLQSVGGNLYLNDTPISKKYSEEEIRQMVNVGGKIYL